MITYLGNCHKSIGNLWLLAKEQKMKRKVLAVVLLSSFWFSNQISSSHGQDWPDPLVKLVSISTDTSTFFTDNRLRFNLVIDRINGSTYSDITRVWICPVSSWDGFLCNAGQFLVSVTPTSSATSFTMESPTLSISEGSYLITGVSFRNGAVLSGFTLMYPRSGVVTIGGIATNIPLVNLAQADFTLAQSGPVIEPEPEPIVEPEVVSEGETEPIAQNESQPETEPATEPDASPEGSSDASDSTHEETPVESEGTTGSEQSAESSETTESIDTTVSEPQTSDSPTNDANDESVAEPASESTGTEATTENPTTAATELDAEVNITNSDVTPSSNVEAGQTQPIVQSQPTVSPDVVSPQPAVVVPEVKPEVAQPEVVTPEVLPEPTTELFSDVVLPTMQQLDRKSAMGGNVIQVTGAAKLVRKVKAGSGSLHLLATNASTLKVWLNQRVIAKLFLTKNQTINWFSRRPGKLKLQLSGDEPKLLLDFLKVNGKLIKNPLFQMRS